MSDAAARVGELRRFRPYEEYRDSKVAWLGKIPLGWEVTRVSDLATLINGFPFDSDKFNTDQGWPLVRIRDLESDKTEIYYDGPVVPAALVSNGDILIGMDGDFNVARWRGTEALLNQRLCCLRPLKSADGRFLRYSIPFPLRIINDLTHSTTVKHLSSGQVRKIRIALPPPQEQRAISDFLDRETSKIDALVAKKKRLIELLQEKRTALITHAVTKGLDPNAPMKPSGIDWLGDIPAHWDLRKMAYLANMQSGGTPSKTNTSYWRGDIPWVSPKDMKTRIISDSIDHVSDAALSETGLQLLAPPVVLIVVRGMILAHSFPVALTDAPLTINQDMKALRLTTDLDPNFFVYCLEGLKELVLSLVAEAGHGTKRLRTDLWRAIELYLPPLGEQRSISRALDTESAKLDLLIRRVGDGVDKLQEYRTALISAAVTGKIDVREEVA